MPTKKRVRPPMQPVVIAKDQIIRFQKNELVRRLIDHGRRTGLDLNMLDAMVDRGEVPQSDWDQLLQLNGYSVSGFGDACPRSPHVARADKKASA